MGRYPPGESRFCVRFFGYIYRGDGGTNGCEILHDGTRVPGVSFPLLGRYLQGSPKFKILAP